MTFKDHFSTHSELYRTFRPVYPRAVFDWVRDVAPRRQRAWDAGTGNGQAAIELARDFTEVIATDPSAEQIRMAQPAPHVVYGVSPAEASGLPDHSVDVCFSAQALHWFDFDHYWAEVRRVASPGGIVIALTYNHPRVSTEVDVVLDDYIQSILGDWPPERRHVNADYATIPFPFERLAVPSTAMAREDDVDAFLGYCATWSAAQRAWRRIGGDPREPFEARLRAAWGSGTRQVQWPLTILAGKVA